MRGLSQYPTIAASVLTPPPFLSLCSFPMDDRTAQSKAQAFFEQRHLGLN